MSENLPKVLIIIPTFNRPQYFSIALKSVINQTYKNLKIVVSDNSTNDETEKFIQPYLETDSRIKYFRHQGFDANDNWNFARQCQIQDDECEYVNWLMDDDIFYPNKIEVMLKFCYNYSNVSMVTSPRDKIDADGNITGREGLEINDARILNGYSLGKDALFNMTNRIGEPTTVLIKKSCLRDGDLCWNEDEKGFFSLIDLSTWLQLLSKGNMAFYPKPLSAFRVHDNMTSFKSKTYVTFWVDWAKLIWSGWKKNLFLDTKEELRAAVLIWLHHASKGLRNAYINHYQGSELDDLERLMFETFKAIENNYEMQYEIKSKGL